MLRGRALSFSIFSHLAILGMAALVIYFGQGPLILAVLFSLSLAVLLFLIRIDIALYIVIALWMMLIAAPLPIASPFTPREMADLPFFQVLTPFLGFCLMLRIAMRKERVSNSPLKIPMLVWFGLIGLTYFRNPIFLGDLFGKSGTGTIYHTVYPLFLCGIFYLSSASILKTEARIILTAKLVFVVMVAGMVLMTFMFFTGWNIPFLTVGIAPWAIKTITYEGETVFRIMAMGRYSSLLFLALLCFGSNLRKPVQIMISVLLAVTLVVSGGRTPFIMVCFYILLSFIIQPKTRWLAGWLSLLLVTIFALVLLLDIKLPHTTQRFVTFSSASRMGVGGRITMVKMSWEAIKRRPFIGYGYGQLWEYFTPDSISKQVASGDPHSGFLAIMTANGLIGLGVFLWLIFTAIKIGWRLYKNIEDGFLKQLMLWITLHLSVSLVMFFISAQMERSIFAYLEMGIISSMYAIFVRKRLPSDLANGEQWFLPKATKNEVMR